jgi:hypothetical protein
MKYFNLSTSLVTSWLLSVCAAQVNVPPGFEPGVKWQIDIQHALDTSAPLVPADAPVWDLDLYFISRNPDTVTYLRVSSGTHDTKHNSTDKLQGTKPRCVHHVLL